VSDVFQVVMPGVMREGLERWLAERGLYMVRSPEVESLDDLPTYLVGISEPGESRFASGGVIPETGDRSDSVPAILNPGCGYFPDPARPPAQHVEITALADLPDRVCLCGARWRGDLEHP
jgi:hypothetical protein